MNISEETLKSIGSAGRFFLFVSTASLFVMTIANGFIGFTNFMQGFDSGNRGTAVSPFPATLANFGIAVYVVSALMVGYSSVSLERFNLERRFKEISKTEELARLVKAVTVQKAVTLGSLMGAGIPAAMFFVLPIDKTKIALAPLSIIVLLAFATVNFFSLISTRKQLLTLEQNHNSKKTS